VVRVVAIAILIIAALVLLYIYGMGDAVTTR